MVNPNRITSENHNELVKCENSEKMQNNNDQKKMFDRYILQISNEMVSGVNVQLLLLVADVKCQTKSF